MKLKRKQKCYLKKKVINREPDGSRYSTFEENAIPVYATLYSGNGKMAEGPSGIVQMYQKKMLYDEPYEITSENGIETYWFDNRRYSMIVGDGICVYADESQKPDYRIVGIYPVGHLKILLEKT